MLTKSGELGSFHYKVLNYHSTVIAIYDENKLTTADRHQNIRRQSVQRQKHLALKYPACIGTKTSALKHLGAKTLMSKRRHQNV